MGFSLSSFLGGAAGAGSEGIDQRTAQAARDKETKEAQQWQIATEGRADARARKAKREAKKAETEERADNLALYFNPDQVKDIMGGGKAQIQYALDYASKLPAGQDASANYKTSSQIAAVPSISGSPTSMANPFTSRFKPSASVLEKYEGLYGNMLGQNTRNMMKAKQAGDTDALTKIATARKDILSGLKQYEATKREEGDDLPSTDIFVGSYKETKALDDVVTGNKRDALVNADMLELDPTGKRYIRKQGSLGTGHSAQIANLNILSSTLGQYSDSLVLRVGAEIEQLANELRADGIAKMNTDIEATINDKIAIPFQNEQDFLKADIAKSIKAGSLVNVNGKFFYYTGTPTAPYSRTAEENQGDLQNYIALN